MVFAPFPSSQNLFKFANGKRCVVIKSQNPKKRNLIWGQSCFKWFVISKRRIRLRLKNFYSNRRKSSQNILINNNIIMLFESPWLWNANSTSRISTRPSNILSHFSLNISIKIWIKCQLNKNVQQKSHKKPQFLLNLKQNKFKTAICFQLKKLYTKHEDFFSFIIWKASKTFDIE